MPYGKQTMNSIFHNDMVQNFGKKVIHKTTYRVTGLGQQKAEDMAVDGDKLSVLTTIEEQGGCSISEIEQTTHINKNRIQAIIHEFMQLGWITTNNKIQSNREALE
jgi:transcription initiation factor IIE alpha subunit